MSDETEKCLVCLGTGKVMVLKPLHKRGLQPCIRCKGTGIATGKWALNDIKQGKVAR